MRRLLLSAAVAVLLLSAGPAARAGLTVNVTNVGGGGNSVNVNPGDSFSVQINLDIAGVAIVSAEMYLEASAANVLDITGGAYNGTDWDAGALALAIPVGGLDARSVSGVGSLPVGGSIGPAVSTLATLDLQVDPGAPAGSYTLNVTDIVAGGETMTDIGGSPGDDFTVVVGSGAPSEGGDGSEADNGGASAGGAGGSDASLPAAPAICGAGVAEALAVSLVGLLLTLRVARGRRP